MGLPEGHPEKDGVLVNISDLPTEVKKRLAARDAKGVNEVANGIEQVQI